MKSAIAAIVVVGLLALGAIVWVFVGAPAPPVVPRPAETTPHEEPSTTEPSDTDAPSVRTPHGDFVGGRVVDPSGRPIAGALVWTIGADERDVPAEGQVSTDRGGRFRLAASERGMRDVGAWKAGWMPVLLRDVAIDPAARRDDLSIVLGDGAEISGHVRDPKGRGLPGARLACVADAAPEPTWRDDAGRLPGRASLASITLVTRTDASGAYAFRGLEPHAAYRVSPISGEFYATGNRGDDRLRRVGAPASNVDFTMQASAVVVLRIVDGATDEPVGGCALELTGASVLVKRVPEASSGPIRLDRDLRPGHHRLVVNARCFEPAEREFDLVLGAPLELVVRLVRKEGVVPGTLIVHARDELGAPVPDLVVTASGLPGVVEVAPSDDEPAAERASGVREIRNVEPGEYRIEVTSASRDYESAETSATVRANDTTPVDVVVPGAGRLTVDVRGPDGEFTAGYRIELRRPDGKALDADIRLPASGSFGRIVKGFVDARGPLDVGRVHPGLVTVVASGEGFETATETVDVRRGEETKVALTLRKAP